MKKFTEINKEEQQIHNDYINCTKEYPKDIILTDKEEIEKDFLILKRSVTYCRSLLTENDYEFKK